MIKHRCAPAAFALAFFAAASGAKADWSPFATYWQNVARAAAQNDAASVEQMVGTGGNPNQTDEEGRTGLHICAMNGNVPIARILLRAGAKLNVTDRLGNTPLHLAAERSQNEIAELLIDAGAKLDIENNSGMTPLMIAASRGDLELVRALLAKGANVAKTDYTGRDAAGWAEDSHRPAVIQAIRRALAAKGS
jgi:ankyrin repeat protein